MEIYALYKSGLYAFEMQKSKKYVGVLFVESLTVFFSVYILKENLSQKYTTVY